MFQGLLHGLNHGGDGLGQGFGHLFFVNFDFFGHALNHVATTDFDDFTNARGGLDGRSNFYFDALGRGFTNQQAACAAHVTDDVFIHNIAPNPNGSGIHQSPQGCDGHLCGAPANVHHHASFGLGDRNAGTQSGCHGFLNQINRPRTGTFGGFLNGAAFNFCGAGGDTNHHAWVGKHFAIMHFLNKVFDHFLGDMKIRNHAVAQGTYRRNVGGGFSQHLFGIGPDGQNNFFIFYVGNGNHRRFIQHDPAPLNINQRVGRSQVNGHIRRNSSKKS